MTTRSGRLLIVIALTCFFLGLTMIGTAETIKGMDPTGLNRLPTDLNEKVRHELAILPYLGVFDNLEYTIENANTVVLTGQVVRPLLKSDAEKAIRRIQGVTKVVNDIEVLPLSHFDNVIRLQAYRAIFSGLGFEKYGPPSFSSIKIIVKHGNITLDGIVLNQMDKMLVGMAANSISGVYRVTNNLKIE